MKRIQGRSPGHHEQWLHEVRDPESTPETTWGYAGGIHLARDKGLTGCCVAAFRDGSWHWCGMPVSAAVDLEVEGIERYAVCFHHAGKVAKETRGSIPIYAATEMGQEQR